MIKHYSESILDSGVLNRRVQIQLQSTAQDAFGAPVASWTTSYTCWAAIEPYVSPRGEGMVYAPAEFLSKATIEITVRWTSSITFKPNMRVIYTEGSTGVVHTYNVESILNPGQTNRQLIFKVYELGAGE